MARWLMTAVVLPVLGCATAPVAGRVVAPVGADGRAPPAPAQVVPGSLYARLGGVDALRAVVPRFLERVAADERINYFFALSDLETLRGRLVDYFCSATGGPCAYGGRDMKAAHAALPIGPKHFDALVEDLAQVLDELRVPDREKAELLAALGPLRGDIVSVR